jgi:hypothetical protein
VFFILSKEGEGMRFKDHLSEKEKRQPGKPKAEKLSRKDMEELMGTRRDTYKRVRGVMRRK